MDSESNDNNNVQQKTIPPEYKKYLKEYLDLYATCQKYSEVLRDKKKRMNEIKPKLETLLRNLNEDELSVNNGQYKIKITTTERKEPITQDFLMNAISQVTETPQKAAAIVQQLMDKRKIIKKDSSIKVVSSRKK